MADIESTIAFTFILLRHILADQPTTWERIIQIFSSLFVANRVFNGYLMASFVDGSVVIKLPIEHGTNIRRMMVFANKDQLHCFITESEFAADLDDSADEIMSTLYKPRETLN